MKVKLNEGQQAYLLLAKSQKEKAASALRLSVLFTEIAEDADRAAFLFEKFQKEQREHKSRKRASSAKK